MPASRALLYGWPLVAGQAGVAAPVVPVQPVLGPLSISATSFTVGAAAGTVVGTITGKTAGSTLSVSPNDGRLAFNGDQSALVVGLTASSAGSANYAVIETLDGATNSPRSNPVTITVNAAVALANTRNFSPSTLPNLVAMVQAAKAGTGGGLIAMDGTSRTVGYGVGAGGITNSRALGPSGKLASRLAANGVPTSLNSIFGNGLNDTNMANAVLLDPRISYTGAVAPASGLQAFGGLPFLLSAAGTLTFQFAASTDINLFHYQNSSLGTFTYAIDGGTPVTVNSAGTAAYKKISLTGLTNTAHTVVFTWVSGNCYIVGGQASVAGANLIQIVNGGATGVTSTQYNSAAALSGKNMGAALVPKLTLLEFGTNDTTVAAYQTAMTGLVAKARETGDAIIVVPSSTTAGGWNAVQADIRAAALALSDSLNCALIDLNDYTGGYTAMQAASRMFDTVHENEAGYAYEWNMIGDRLLAVSQ